MAKGSVGGRKRGSRKPAEGKHVLSNVRHANVRDASSAIGGHFTAPMKEDTTPEELRPGGGVYP